VEAAAQDDAILLRGSVDPDGPVLVFTHAAWRDLTARIKQKPSRLAAESPAFRVA
jgi:hypothetical protein